MGKAMLTINWEPGFVHTRIRSAVKKVEFISDRVSCITLKGRWCDIIVLNVHAPTEDKDDDVKDSFYEEIERLFDQLIDILLLLYCCRLCIVDYTCTKSSARLISTNINPQFFRATSCL